MICQNIAKIQEEITDAAKKSGRSAKDIKLVAVSKRHPVEMLIKAIDCGQALFGENYIQEAVDKKRILEEKVNIHFIGNLQSNKAKLAAEYFTMVETVDRLKIAKSLNKYLDNSTKILDVLIQVNIGEDENKSGTSRGDAIELVENAMQLPNLRVKGLMTIPPFGKNPEDSRKHFINLRELSEELQEKGFFPEQKPELSMGMSGDFKIAIEEGATIVRVGTAIFGSRPY